MINAQNLTPGTPQQPTPSARPMTPVTTQPTMPTAPVSTPTSAGVPSGSSFQRHWKLIVAVLALLVLMVGSGVGYYLSQQPQDVRQQAAEQYKTADVIIGGLPPQSTIDQYAQCTLYDNPCAAGTGQDSVCTCPGYNITSVGCTGDQSGTYANFGPALQSVQGQSLGCAPVPSPSPSPSPSPLVCGQPCDPATAGQCATGHTCNPTTNTCVLDACLVEGATCDEIMCHVVQPSPSPTPTPTPSPTPTPTPAPTPSPSPTVGCNNTCASNADCTNNNHICYSGRCRLDSNPSNESCSPVVVASPSPTPVAQPPLPQQLPETGPREWGQAIVAGVGIILAGAALLLLL